jgi:hypothetical protein
VPLTQAQINFLANKAQWYVEIDNRRQVDGGDVWVNTGDGVDDLDRLLVLMPTLTVATFRIDVGTQYESWVPCNIADIQAIRTAYIGYFGQVNKPGWPVGFPKKMKLDGPNVQMQVQQP